MKNNLPTNPALFPSGLTLELTSHDVDEMREQSLFWDLDIKQSTRGRFQGKVLCCHTEHLQISRTHRSLGVSIAGTAPQGTAVLSFLLSPATDLFFRGQPFQADQVLAFHADEELELCSAKALDLITIVCSPELIDEKSRNLTGHSFDHLRSQERLFLHHHGYQAKTKHLLSVLQSLRFRADTISSAAEKMVEDEILETVLLDITVPQVVKRKPDRLRIAKKAEEYIRDNPKKSVSINDLCFAIGASERTLHLGFKERFGISPKAYSLMLRLNGVRQELLHHDALRRTITDIAMDWGFFHLGRFASQYSRLFAESPSHTRNRLQT